MSLYLVVPPSDISRTRPLVRLILNQIGRPLIERYDPQHAGADARQLLFMLDGFPALGRLDFFESALAYLAAYRVRAFLVARSLHQIDKAYGHNHSTLDNCHVRVAFTPNDERTARRLSDTLGTATQLRAQRNLSGRRLSAWLPYMTDGERALDRVGRTQMLPMLGGEIVAARRDPCEGPHDEISNLSYLGSACRRVDLLVAAFNRDVPRAATENAAHKLSDMVTN